MREKQSVLLGGTVDLWCNDTSPNLHWYMVDSDGTDQGPNAFHNELHVDANVWIARRMLYLFKMTMTWQSTFASHSTDQW